MIKILELFAGIGACSTALNRLGIEHEIVDAVEIDKYAMKSFNAIHGTNFEPQDITTWNKQLDVDLVMHGSPCQDFSVAGKQAGGDENSGTRSSLMYETLRIIENLKPKYVIWENVKNLLSKKHRHNFDNYLERMENTGYRNYYQVLNAKDYGIPQNRERVFTISIRADIEKEFRFPEKEELKLRLKDMLEEQVDEKYYLTGKQIKRIEATSYVSGGMEQRVRHEDGICNTLAARDYKDPKCVQVGELDIKGHDSVKRVYSDEGLSPTLTDMQGGNRQPKIIEEPFIVASRGRNPENPSSREFGIHTEQRLEPNTRGITNTITSVQKDNYVVIGENQKKVDTFPSMVQKCGDRGKNTYSSSELSYTIPSNAMSDRGQALVDRDIVTRKLRIRKLTPKECWRLMGFHDDEFERAEKVNSNSQLYKQAGNSIVVNVLEKILKNLLEE